MQVLANYSASCYGASTTQLDSAGNQKGGFSGYPSWGTGTNLGASPLLGGHILAQAANPEKTKSEDIPPPLIKLPAPSEAPSPKSDANPEAATAGAPSPAEAGSVGSGKPVPVQPIKLRIALNEGLIKSPRTAAVRALLGIQKAGYWAATEMPNPGLFRDEGAIAEQTRRIGFNLTYDPPWKIVFRLLATKAQMVATKSEILSTLWQFRADVRKAYTECVVSEAMYQTLTEIVELTRRLWQVSQKRFEAGDVPELDVLKARLVVSQAEIDQQQGRTRVLRAKQQLNVMLGREVENPIEVLHLPGFFQLKAVKSEFLPDFEDQLPPLKDYLAVAVVTRPELKVIKNRIKLNRAQLRSAYGNIVPDPNFNVGESVSNNPATGPKLRGIFVTLNIEVPVYTFQQGDIFRLKATEKQLQLEYLSVKNQVIGEVSEAYQNLVVARNRIRTYLEHVLADSDEVARLARRSYEVGQSDITSTLQAQQANIQIRIQYLDSVMAYQQAYTDLERSVGEPLE
jgi:cobalt-zinc-cadmium efflux system outer membrane protein